MDDYLLSALRGCIVGAVGTGFGAVVALFIKRRSQALIASMMGLSGGIMLSVVIFDMVPEGVKMGGWASALVGLILGAFFVQLLHWLFPHVDAPPDCDDISINKIKNSSLAMTGLLLCAGIAIHNLPEGLAIGAGMEQQSDFGTHLSILLLIHNIPEGLAMGIPLRLGGFKPGTVVLLAVAAGLPTAIGAILGTWLGEASPIFIGGAIAFAGGAMLYLTLKELIPESMHMKKMSATVLSLIGGIVIGALVVFVL